MKKLVIHIPRDLKNNIVRLAQSKNIPISELVRKCIATEIINSQKFYTKGESTKMCITIDDELLAYIRSMFSSRREVSSFIRAAMESGLKNIPRG